MPPPPSIDFSDDLDDIPTNTNTTANPTSNGATKSSSSRTLLLAPPSLASHPDKLSTYVSNNYPDRSHADVQMLDRLSMGLVALPSATFDLVLLLADADGSRTESSRLLDRTVVAKCVQALKPGGWLRSQDDTFAQDERSAERTEAVLAGLTAGAQGMQKPAQTTTAVPLKLGRKIAKQNIEQRLDGAGSNGHSTTPDPQLDPAPLEAAPPAPSVPAGVGFDDSDDIDLDDLVGGSDDELIDENDLLTEEDKQRPVNIPAECQPVGRKKRRRACKDCTCGLAQKLEAEDAAKRAKADAALSGLRNGETKTSDANGGPNACGPSTVGAGGQPKTAMLGEEDLAEVDFTVQGKVGSCGNCALGDAFRCDGCPYIGLPAFKPGEEVRLVNNDVQL